MWVSQLEFRDFWLHLVVLNLDNVERTDLKESGRITSVKVEGQSSDSKALAMPQHVQAPQRSGGQRQEDRLRVARPRTNALLWPTQTTARLPRRELINTLRSARL